MQKQGGWRRSVCSQERFPICKAFTPEQIQQLTTPTYRDGKNKDKTVSASPIPTLVDPSQVSVLERVDGEKVAKPETTPTGKKKHSDESPKPSKRKPSSRPSTDNLKYLEFYITSGLNALQGRKLCYLQSPLQSLLNQW